MDKNYWEWPMIYHTSTTQFFIGAETKNKNVYYYFIIINCITWHKPSDNVVHVFLKESY